MNFPVPMLVLVCLLPITMYGDTAIDLARFQLQIEKGTQASSEVVDDPDEGQKVLLVTVSKPGPEFWSVELRAPGFQFEAGKHYELTFRAKCSPGEYVYFAAEKDSGNQESIAAGTSLRIPEQWTDCTVALEPTADGDPARLTISDLSVEPSSFRFRDFRLIEK